MIDLRHVRSLSDFQRNTKEHLRRLKDTGKPEVLTVNGRAQLVVQSADSYQQLAEDAEVARSMKLIRKSLAQARNGKGRPMKQFVEELAAKHGIDLNQ